MTKSAGITLAALIVLTGAAVALSCLGDPKRGVLPDEDARPEPSAGDPDVVPPDATGAASGAPEASSASDPPHVAADRSGASTPVTARPASSTSPVYREVVARAKTSALPGTGDVADDSVVWVHRTAPERSVIIATNKSSGPSGGLFVFRLDGTRHGGGASWEPGVDAFALGSRPNNVDLRRDVPFGDSPRDLVAASNRADRRIDIYIVKTAPNGDFHGLQPVGEVPIGREYSSGSDAPYGVALSHSPGTGRYFVLASDHGGRLGQFELVWKESVADAPFIEGRALGPPLQVSDGTCPIEGMVSDDAREVIYVSSEDHGLYRFGTRGGVIDPSDVVTVARAATTRSRPSALVADAEGVTILERPAGGGYVIVSSQGQDLSGHPSSSTLVVFRRDFVPGRPNDYVTNLRIVAGTDASGAKIDGTQWTDGVAACGDALGPGFPEGIVVVHDGLGDDPTTFKLVSWADVAVP